MHLRTLKPILFACLLLIRFPHSSLAQEATASPTSLSKYTMASLETTLKSTRSRNDVSGFQAASTDSLTITIPKAVLQISQVVISSVDKLGDILSILSPIFSILSIIADIIGATLFSQDRQFADLYVFLQDNFAKVNAMLETNFHAIKELQNVVQCGQTYSLINDYKTQINSFYNRYLVMMERAQADRSGTLAILDVELRQYQSVKMLLGMQQLLQSSGLYASIITNCAKGSLQDFLRMMVELQYTFRQASMLDKVVKIPLLNNSISKQAMEIDQAYWQGQVFAVENRISQAAFDLVTNTWYNFYYTDIESSLSSLTNVDAQNASDLLSNFLTAKYPYVRTAVIIAPWDIKSIAITDAFGVAIVSAGNDSFICYSRNRTNPNGKPEHVIVICRNTIVFPTEQSDVDSAYANVGGNSRIVQSLSLANALRSDRWYEVMNYIKLNRVSFFAVKVKIQLSSGSVATAQSAAAANMTFFQNSETTFQALVISKLMRAGSRSFDLPDNLNAALSLRAQLPLVAGFVLLVVAVQRVYGE